MWVLIFLKSLRESESSEVRKLSTKPNHTYQTKHNQPDITNQTYQTKPTKPNVTNQSYLTKPKLHYHSYLTKPKLHNQAYFTKNMLVNQNEEGSNQSTLSQSLPWTLHSSAPVCIQDLADPIYLILKTRVCAIQFFMHSSQIFLNRISCFNVKTNCFILRWEFF